MEIQDAYEINKRNFIHNVRGYLTSIEIIANPENRANIAYDLFNYLYDNIDFVVLNSKFCGVVIERAIEIKKDIESGRLNITSKTRNRLAAALDRVREAILEENATAQ